MLALLDAHRSDTTALIEPAANVRMTYGALHAAVERAGRQLLTHGVQPGDVVAFSMGNGPEIVIAFLAVLAAGAAAAPLNPAYTTEEFRGYLSDLQPRAMMLVDGQPRAAVDACEALAVPVIASDGTEAGLAPGRAPAAAPLPPRDPEAVALLLHTSGTTSRPKVVPLRQRNLTASASTIARHYQLGPDDTSHCVMPLFHVHGLIASTLATLSAGGRVIVPRRFSASQFWSESRSHRATWFSASPTIYAILLRRAQEAAQREHHHLRFARSCSSALAPSLWAAWETTFDIPLVEAYGMTEASHQMSSNPIPPGDRRPGTVGTPTGTAIRVVDDAWKPLGGGEVGELVVCGAGVVDNYRDNPEANAASFHDGWFRTGDSGTLSDDGYVSLRGRIKELINRGGEKISPHEVEDALLAHPAVVEAVAFAVPDEIYGEEVCAAVVTRTPVDASTLKAHCAERLAAFKTPERIVLVDQIPRGPTGKVQRRRIAEHLEL